MLNWHQNLSVFEEKENTRNVTFKQQSLDDLKVERDRIRDWAEYKQGAGESGWGRLTDTRNTKQINLIVKHKRI